MEASKIARNFTRESTWSKINTCQCVSADRHLLLRNRAQGRRSHISTVKRSCALFTILTDEFLTHAELRTTSENRILIHVWQSSLDHERTGRATSVANADTLSRPGRSRMRRRSRFAPAGFLSCAGRRRLNSIPAMGVTLARASLFDAASENDFTLLEDNGEYFVSFGDRTGTYREFVQMLSGDDELMPELLTGEVRANFLTLMKAVSHQRGDRP
jgi:hypothetical protein